MSTMIGYGEEITALQALGFRQLAFRPEAKGPFSALMYRPVLPLMRRAKEVSGFSIPFETRASQRPLRTL